MSASGALIGRFREYSMSRKGRMQPFEGIWTPAGGRALEGLGREFAANHFDVVPVRTNDEGCTQSEPDCVELSSPRAAGGGWSRLRSRRPNAVAVLAWPVPVRGSLDAPQVPRLRLTVPIGSPCFPRYSRTTTTPWSISGRKSGFAQPFSFIVGVNFASNVVLSTPFDSAFTSVYMTVSLSPGPALAPSNLVSGSSTAGAAPLAWPAISASLL